MVDNIQLTSQQKLQQEKINAYITSLEEQIQGGGDNIQLDEKNQQTLIDVLGDGFDTNNNGQINLGEADQLVSHLKDINSNQNIANIFDANGNLQFNSGGLDITNDGEAAETNDFVALSNILDSKAAEEYEESVSTGKGSTIELENGKTIKHGLGNDAAIFSTEGGYHIATDTNKGGMTTKIYDSEGEMITRVWGDPHVNEGKSTANKGDDWHFGDDSTFILDDGTEILFNTEAWGRKGEENNIYVTNGLYIVSGDDVYHTGKDLTDEGPREDSFKKLEMSAIEFDATHADAKAEDDGADTFVYSKAANEGNGGWAVLTDQGTFEDIAYESWGDYKKGAQDGVSQTFDNQTVDTGSVVNNSINLEQKEAALDGEAVRVFDDLENLGATDNQKEAFFDYYFEEGATAPMLDVYTQLVEMDATDAQFETLDEYIKNPPELEVDLTEEQEANYLMYLVTNENLSEMYLDLVEETNSDETGASDAKLELFENSTLGDNPLNANQAANMLEYADQGIEIAEAYVDLVKGGAEDKVDIFEGYMDKVGNVDTEDLGKFTDALTEATDQEASLLERLVSDENGSMGLLNAAVDIMNNPESVSLRDSGSGLTNTLIEYAFGQEDLFKEVLNYQNSQLDSTDNDERGIITKNSDLLRALDEAQEGRGAYGDILNANSQAKLNNIFDKLDSSANGNMQDLGDVLEIFNTSMNNGRASEDREAFYKDVFMDLLEINPNGMSDEDFTAAVSESVFQSVQMGKQTAPESGVQYDAIEDLVAPFAESAQVPGTVVEVVSDESTSILDQLKGNADYELVGVIAEAFTLNENSEFTAGLNEIVAENPGDVDKVGQETAKLLINMYESMLDAERAKDRPSTSMIRTWEANVDSLQGIANG